MVTARRSRVRGGQEQAARSTDKSRTRVELEYRDIHDLQNYDFNPRDNAPAIESVANSIRTFGFLIPVVVDANNVLVAGHTRVAAAKTLGMDEVPVVQVGHLSEAEINAFRVIDNKVAELAKWDFDLLAGEISKLQGSGLTLTDFGWSREEIDCLTDVVADDCLNTDNLVDIEARERIRRAERRAPATARFVLGELVFFIPASEYREWVNGIRTLCDYDEQAITAELKRRLGIIQAN
jgi:hypothetical protein